MSVSFCRYNSEESIYKDLERLFHHPGTLLFRGRELSEVNRYLSETRSLKPGRIMDFGCAEGKIGNMLFNKIDMGLDISIGELKKAKNLSAYTNLVSADGKKMPFKDSAFDMIFCNSVIEHIKDISGILGEVSRVLRKGGLFISTVPSDKISEYLYFAAIFKKLKLTPLARIYARVRNRQLGHFNLCSIQKWKILLENASLSVVYYRHYLSARDIYEWDKMGISLRLSKPLPFLRSFLIKKFFQKAKMLLSHKEDGADAALLMVAKRR